jgi:hypothetical protein
MQLKLTRLSRNTLYFPILTALLIAKGVIVCEISSSHSGEYDVQNCLQG